MRRLIFMLAALGIVLLCFRPPVLAKDSAKALYSKGTDAEARQNYEQAFEYFKQAYDLKPKELRYRTAFERNRFLAASAEVHRGQILRDAGKLDEALTLYQRTLELDATNGDNSATAADWFSYGHFLDQSGFPEKLAYACLVKAESTAKLAEKSPLPEAAAITRAKLEKQIGPVATSIRRNPEPALQEAMQLRR